MKFASLFLGLIVGVAIIHASEGEKLTLFDFTTVSDVKDWTELSDPVRRVGKSKGVMVLQKTQEFQRAIFFSLLNPQPNGAGFAGVKVPTNLNLTGFNSIELRCRGQGSANNYKVVIDHKGHSPWDHPTYEQYFTAPMSSEEFSTVTLPLANFKPYFHGREVPDGEPLDVEEISTFGFQIYGGVYMPVKQRGVSALEIESVSAVI